MAENKNTNSSGWLTEAEKARGRGIKTPDLRFLEQDKTGILLTLEKLGLPYTIPHFLDSPKSREARETLERINCFCRLVPKKGGNRPFRLNISSARELEEFCSEYNLADYTIMLIERGNVTHSGSIVSQEDTPGIPGRCIVELVEGSGVDLIHGRKTPVSAVIDEYHRALSYAGFVSPTSEERALVFGALKLVGGPKNPLPGYYEFDVRDRRQIVFRNYQSPKTAYAQLPTQIAEHKFIPKTDESDKYFKTKRRE